MMGIMRYSMYNVFKKILRLFIPNINRHNSVEKSIYNEKNVGAKSIFHANISNSSFAKVIFVFHFSIP